MLNVFFPLEHAMPRIFISISALVRMYVICLHLLLWLKTQEHLSWHFRQKHMFQKSPKTVPRKLYNYVGYIGKIAIFFDRLTFYAYGSYRKKVLKCQGLLKVEHVSYLATLTNSRWVNSITITYGGWGQITMAIYYVRIISLVQICLFGAHRANGNSYC